MNETELSRIALAERRADVQPQVLADIAKSDGSSSIHGRHRHLTDEIAEFWPILSIDQRLVAYIMANELASRVG